MDTSLFGQVQVGIDQLFKSPHVSLLQGKKIGLITNQTAINKDFLHTKELLKQGESRHEYQLVALFAPEHGFYGHVAADERIEHSVDREKTPIYSLYGATRRPTAEMLEGITLLIYDIQDIGSRPYTYATTLFYSMEEAAKRRIPVMVLDRPNPINGVVIDGPMMEPEWRSIIGYINVPYCHGMTIGELARFFNEEYRIGCQLSVVPMKDWNRSMTFIQTGLPWIPTSPNVPDCTTPLYYPITGLLGELSFVSIGAALLPFRLVGSSWIDGVAFADYLNKQSLTGVRFLPYCFRPLTGKYAKQDCQGAYIIVTDPKHYQPFATQAAIFGALKHLYPEQMETSLKEVTNVQKRLFAQASGSEETYRILKEMPHVIWPLRALHQKEREAFLNIRTKYLIPDYSMDAP